MDPEVQDFGALLLGSVCFAMRIECRLSSQNEELQEQLRTHQQEAYSLRQELFRLSRENQALQEKVCVHVCVDR